MGQILPVHPWEAGAFGYVYGGSGTPYAGDLEIEKNIALSFLKDNNLQIVGEKAVVDPVLYAKDNSIKEAIANNYFDNNQDLIRKISPIVKKATVSVSSMPQTVQPGSVVDPSMGYSPNNSTIVNSATDMLGNMNIENILGAVFGIVIIGGVFSLLRGRG